MATTVPSVVENAYMQEYVYAVQALLWVAAWRGRGISRIDNNCYLV